MGAALVSEPHRQGTDVLLAAESRLKIVSAALDLNMLEDRDYMRQPEYRDPVFRGFRWSWTVALLLAYAVVFVVEILVSPAPQRLVPGNFFCNEYFALSREGIERGFVWQLVTYQFMHASLTHLFFNGWAIYAFGRELEMLLGGKKYLALFFSSGIVGGVFQVLSAMLWPQYFGGSVVGASACAFGLVAAFALMFPDRELTILLFFVIPLHLRAKTLLVISAVLAVGGVVFSESVLGGNVANAAHLGGMAMGCFFVRQILQGHWWRRTGRVKPVKAIAPGRPALEPLPKKVSADFLAEEVDPILDKISAHGIQSLTAREREILESARKKMTRS
jgi:membrane associated rhomboid family serine protease